MPRPQKLIARDARILAAYSAGATIPQIAAAEQIGLAIVRNTLRRHDIPCPRGRRQFTEDQERRVQRTIEQLRACDGDYLSIHEELERKRLAWWKTNHEQLQLSGSPVRQAYTLFLLDYLGLDAAEVPIVHEDDRRIVWRSVNFCSMLEACRRLGLDTRVVCRAATERSVETLIRRLDDRLRFGRNYTTGMRPHAAYCEEEIWLAD